MKLVIQIPCFNEAETVAETLRCLPRSVEGFDEVEVLVIDDGSRDATVEVAREAGADHVVELGSNRGLAMAFLTGLRVALERGADVVVNTDADNQYRADDLPALVEPILEGRADLVVGARPIEHIRHFSWLKKLLQRLGSAVVRRLSGTEVVDAPSGFRAMTREAAMRLTVFSGYTYTLETIIQAGHSGLRVVNVPVRVNAPTRPSRLIRSVGSYLRRSVATLLSTYLIYRPVPLFGALAALFLLPAGFLAGRYLWLDAIGDGTGHVQSVIASGVLAIAGTVLIAIAILAHLLAINRRLLQELRFEQQRRALGGPDRPRLERDSSQDPAPRREPGR